MFFVIIYTKNIYPTDAKTTVGVEVLARTLCFLSELTPNTYPTDAKTGVGEVATKTRLNLFTASFVARSHREPVFA